MPFLPGVSSFLYSLPIALLHTNQRIHLEIQKQKYSHHKANRGIKGIPVFSTPKILHSAKVMLFLQSKYIRQ